jgi:origin recognition complex subunit 6
MPAIRELCKGFKKPSAAPHVFVGVFSILKLLQEQTSSTAILSRKRARRSSGNTPKTQILSFDDKQIPALIAVVAIYTLSVLSPQDFEGGEEYKKKRELAVEILLRIAPEDSTTEDEMSDDVELFLREAQNGWLDMEWYQNLLDQSKADELDNEASGPASDDRDKEREDEEGSMSMQVNRSNHKEANGVKEDGRLSTRAGGGMMTPATDWLSEEKKRDFRQWKAKFLVELDRVEKGKRKSTV